MAMRIRIWSVVLLGGLVFGVSGCARFEPQLETAKSNLDRADSYFSRLLGVERSASAEPGRRLSPSEAESHYRLGLQYFTGKGASRDPNKAARHLALAAENGHTGAQYTLGRAYELSADTADDKVEAMRWYRAAAEGGHARAQFRLAEAYLNGDGIPQDDAEAAGWYRKAADNGHVQAQFMLGQLYVLGKGVKQDRRYALYWFSSAADKGHPRAGSRRDALKRQILAADTGP